jgi:hypothetical protein
LKGETTMDNEMNLELGEMLEQRIQENFSSNEGNTYDVSDERLKEMNKKLPNWSLEPPFSFLK